jgi:hypothetical protein
MYCSFYDFLPNEINPMRCGMFFVLLLRGNAGIIPITEILRAGRNAAPRRKTHSDVTCITALSPEYC